MENNTVFIFYICALANNRGLYCIVDTAIDIPESFLSMQAAVHAPIILMSQNRQAKRDRSNAELEIMLPHEKVDLLEELDLLRETMGRAAGNPERAVTLIEPLDLEAICRGVAQRLAA